MVNENPSVSITEEDLLSIESELTKIRKPFLLKELAEKLAFRKTAHQRTQAVKKYDPFSRYEIGDSICKEYDEALTVSSKTVEHFKGTVVLKVINKSFYKSFNCEMLEVDYAGGGVFRRYIDYMRKTKTQVLLPSNLEGKAQTPETMAQADDPRLTELPMTDKDLKTLERNLRTALQKSPRFFSWNDFWQLESNQMAVPEDKVKEMEAHIQEIRLSVPTEELVRKFFGLEASHDLFDLHCLSLNHQLEKKFKKEFVFVSPLLWGKWHLKKILNALPENLPLTSPAAQLPPLEVSEKSLLSTFHTFPLKVYLTWREILSGGIKVPRSLNKELSYSREYIFTDVEEGKNYVVYYYPTSCYFIGLKDCFAENNIPQGTSITLEKKGPIHFHFWLKKSKKKIAVPRLTYSPQEDSFADSGEEVFTFALPNKIIYLERDVLQKLLSLYPQRNGRNLLELLILIFKNFSLEADSYSLHFLRAYHLVDLLRQTTQEDVELALLNSSEFVKSEKKKGIFFYQEPVIIPQVIPEAPPEIAEEILPEAISEELPEVVPPSEISEQAAPAVEVLEKPRPEAPRALRKEKLPKKKKVKPEGEKLARVRKSERRVIEEKIESEESAIEALSAIKEEERIGTAEEEREAIPAQEKKEEFKPAPSETPTFGIFAEKLKSALKKKEEKKK